MKTLSAQLEIDISYRQRLRWVLSNLDSHDRVVLDVGCGDAFLLRRIASTQVYRVGIDSSYQSLKASKIVSSSLGLVCASGSHLPFRSAVFDTVIMMEVLEHLLSPRVALLEASRVMSSKSKLLVTVPNLNFPSLWDPISKVIACLGAHPLRTGMLAGFWYMHHRLYDVQELNRELQECFVTQEVLGLTHFFLPFYPYIVNIYANVVYHLTKSPFKLPWPLRAALNFLDRRNLSATNLNGAATIFASAIPRKRGSPRVQAD